MTAAVRQVVTVDAPESPELATMERGYYVTVYDRIDNAGTARVGVVAGPFRSLAEAESRRGPCADEARRRDPWADFYSFGVALMERHAPAKHNAAFGLSLDAEGFVLPVVVS